MNSIPVKFLLGKTFGKNPADVAENAIQGSPKLGANSQTAKEEQEELLRQRELEEKQLAEKQAVRRYERANVRQNIRDKYKLTKGS
ncbi:Oidioi.mRNA.OKI2018_I69.chr2.g4201.t1.cds [Oikopleura dioica]|uniref:Oidioi.mRNA.OKI2018_I69.chr2.g4201.t1.cds n=1 Tax=Oikopleura dioica TaxID=34765 RepID=A0ABN7SWI4_OIKDI|nr:Oidioi.mRNA.OKI2018_I69.chr2.g4201.t1.cds [Oikopleura dioica]